MQKTYAIERRIEIDAGHRVTYHASKCKNLHGHRYIILATCEGALCQEGEEEGMVLDFGFLKEEMVQEIHAPCDHTMILWENDPLARRFIDDDARFDGEIKSQVTTNGYYHTLQSVVGALYVIDCVPTAENLAAHWYARLLPRVEARSQGRAKLKQIKVFETPNCMAVFPSE